MKFSDLMNRFRKEQTKDDDVVPTARMNRAQKRAAGQRPIRTEYGTSFSRRPLVGTTIAQRRRQR